MNIHYITPYSLEKNLGKAYNEAMQMIPDQDSACFTDGDSMFLTPDFGHLIHRYATANPAAVLTCYLNRIHELAKGQQSARKSSDVADCIKFAESIRDVTDTTPIVGSVSGTLLLIPKSVWIAHPFSEVNTFRPNEPNLLGVDNEWTNRIRAAGVQVLRMNGIFLFHQYRLVSNSKQHLL